jgi:hypothetical protein
MNAKQTPAAMMRRSAGAHPRELPGRIVRRKSSTANGQKLRLCRMIAREEGKKRRMVKVIRNEIGVSAAA